MTEIWVKDLCYIEVEEVMSKKKVEKKALSSSCEGQIQSVEAKE